MRRVRSLLLLSTALLLACGETSSVVDAGVISVDAGPVADAAVQDSGGVDAAAPVDAGIEDAAGGPTDAASTDAAPPPPDVAALYPTGRTQSPLTESVATKIAEIVSSRARQDDVFSKVGASATKNSNFMHCFAGPFVDVAGRDGLLPTIGYFRAADVMGTTPFDRESEAATVGWSAGAAIDGNPSPLEQELAAADPRLAVVMYGTNDIQQNNIERYENELLALTDQLIAAGVIPLLTSIMPRDDSASADLEVPRYNAVVRGIAQARQVPFIDYERELRPLADHGIGPDGIHPTVHRTTAGARGCDFGPEGLMHGYNIRNLITIEALDRVKRAVLDGEAAPDASAPVLAGEGTRASPFVISPEQLPFSDLRNTAQFGSRLIDAYAGCNATQNESGPEVFYRLELTQPARIHAFVFDRGDVDIDLHLLDGSADGDGCIDRAHREIEADLMPGTYHFALDTFVSSAGAERSGEYLFVVLAE